MEHPNHIPDERPLSAVGLIFHTDNISCCREGTCGDYMVLVLHMAATDVLSQYQPTTWSKQQQLWELGTIKTRELGCRCSNGVMSPPTAQHPGTDELESFRYLRAKTSGHHLRSSPAASPTNKTVELQYQHEPSDPGLSHSLWVHPHLQQVIRIYIPHRQAQTQTLLLSAVYVVIPFSYLLCAELSNVLNCALMLWSCLRLICF